MNEQNKTKLVSSQTGILLIVYCVYIVVVWFLYRYFFVQSEDLDELIIKPILWVLPIGVILYAEEAGPESLGMTNNNLRKSILYGSALGLVFFAEAFVLNYFKYGVLSINTNVGALPIVATFVISAVTSIIEEIAFRGYMLNRLLGFYTEFKSIIINVLLWVLVHVPVALFIWHLEKPAVLIYLLLVGIYGLGAGLVFSRTRNILSVIILHILWSWPIILFK